MQISRKRRIIQYMHESPQNTRSPRLIRNLMPVAIPVTRGAKGYYKFYKGKTRWIGPLSIGDEAAILSWAKMKDDIDRGYITDRVRPVGGLTFSQVAQRFIESKRSRLEAGRISADHYRKTFRRVMSIVVAVGPQVSADGETPSPWMAAGRRMSSKTSSEKRKIATLLVEIDKYACRNALVNRPLCFGSLIDDLRSDIVHMSDPIVYTPAECLLLLQEAKRRYEAVASRPGVSPAMQLYACVLLGLNGGFGSRELAKLKKSEVDIVSGFIRNTRPKTGQPRRCALWPVTLEIMKKIMEREDHEGLVFRTREGFPLCREVARTADDGSVESVTSLDALGQSFTKLATACGIKKKDSGFYVLRKTFRTIAGELNDPDAADVIMGHKQVGVRSHYQLVSDDRIRAMSMSVLARIGF